MSAFITGALYAAGAVTGLVLVVAILGGAFRAARGWRTPRQPEQPKHVPRRSPPNPPPGPPPRPAGQIDPQHATHDERVHHVIAKAAEFDLALRTAMLGGVPVDLSLEQRKHAAYPKGRSTLVVRTTQSDGTVKQWPPA